MKTPYILSLIISFFILQMQTRAQSYFQKTYPMSNDQEGQDVLPTSDGGYLIAGYTNTSILYDCDLLIIKTDAVGNKLWSKTYGGNKPDFPYHMLATNDGNYFLIGYSQSYGGGDMDILLQKIDPSGNQIWLKTYGGSGNDYARDVTATADGNYMIVGSSNSQSTTGQNANLIKIDPSGNVIWNKTYGGSANDHGCIVKQCSDGGYIMLGQTYSYGIGNGDAWLVKMNSNGDTTWTKTFGGSQNDEGVSLAVNSDDSFTFLIRDSSTAGKDIDIRVVKTSSTGNVMWNKVYGGSQKDTPKMIQHTSDGGYVIAGISRSFGWINPDMYVLKLTNSGDTTWTRHFGGANHEHCYAVRELSDGSYIAVGKSASYGPDIDPILLKINSNGLLSVGLTEYASLSSAIQLYPNPNKGELNLDLSNFKATKITVLNTLGEMVYSKNIENEQKINIKLPDQKTGLYFIRTESETHSVTNKFIIN
ncbi:MAG: T9SS type A sorting domain-containing protein [Burkholderiales bacterium]|nr:T9SS type A sorting domain-containing protein [Bacteroidia bacterium]